MKVLRKTVLTVTALVFSFLLALFLTTLFTAACSDKVTLSFETFGGTRIEAISQKSGTEISVPDDPEKTGYVFVGWYLDKNFEGETQTLPDVMPEESVTYYARFEQYPLLTLELNGGALSTTEYYVEEGTNLSGYLSEIIPVKTGLTFGAWLLDGEILPESAEMPATDLTLTARYIASYRVEIYLQTAESEETYALSESTENVGWEGAAVSPAVPSYKNYVFCEERSTAVSKTLSAGENLFSYYLKRADSTVIYISSDPTAQGGDQTRDVQTYYGATIVLPESEDGYDGYLFWGWAEERGGDAVYRAGDKFQVQSDKAVLYAVWAKVYTDGAGSGRVLAVSQYRNADGTSEARLYETEGKTADGIYNASDGFFSVGETVGKLDGHGNFLLSDSGVYAGYSLALNAADASCGTLTLDFTTGAAVYAVGDAQTAGTYSYVYDEEAAQYLGYYRFQVDTEFFFLLKDGYFLKEGEEKNTYYFYDCFSDEYDKSAAVTLDGLGNAVLIWDGVAVSGNYRGGGTNQWILSADGGEFRILAGRSERTVNGTVVQSTPVFLLYDAACAGSYVSETGETLVLDGYGYCAEYRSSDGMKTGVYRLEDGIVTVIFSDGTVLSFSLDDAGGFSAYGDADGEI